MLYCPSCPGERLVRSTCDDVEIDSCPHCRGIWLDRGELATLRRAVAAEADGVTVERVETDERDESSRSAHAVTA